MDRTFIGYLNSKIDQSVSLAGWVSSKRNHGKVVFLDIKDSTGIIQTVATASQEFFVEAAEVKEQSAVRLTGTVKKRPAKMISEGLNGDIELQIEAFAIVTPSVDFPWGAQSSESVNEELRMRYRYLDMRNDRVKNNLKLRAKVNHFFRQYLTERDFIEIETPYITRGTPEGAREFLIPSRLQPGQFYALPQSPQQFKQLLMVAGFDRYFSIARCFRDEDPRGDRQSEFTQLDMEMSFVSQEDILTLAEQMFIELIAKVTPEKKISQVPFPRIPFATAMEKYGTDKPDLRQDKNDPNELAFCWIIDWPLFEYSETDQKLVASHHLFSRPKDGDESKLFTSPEKVMGQIHDIVLNGYEVGGGSVRIHEPELQRRVFKVLGITDEEAENRFGHLLEAFKYGPPPHGGIAPGLDRLVMILANEPNIREVIAFPKTGDGRDLMMGAPALVSQEQLKEIHWQAKKAGEPLSLDKKTDIS